MSGWERLSPEETVYETDDGVSLRLTRSAVAFQGETWTQHVLVAQEGRDGAVVVALDARSRVLLVRQARPAVGDHLWELPRGFAERQDAGATATAVRELAEETGSAADRTCVIGALWADSALLGNRVVVVEVRTSGPAQIERGGEVEDARWVTEQELDGLVRDGTVCDGISLAALTVWRATTE